YHVAVKLPGATQLVLEQESARARRFAIDAVVSPHHGFCFALYDRGAERGQVSVFHVVPGYLHINGVPCGLGTAVHSKMLRRGDDPKIFRIVSLQSRDECHAHASREKRVLAVSLLASAPSWVTEDVDVGRPEVQTFHDVASSSSDGLVMFRPCFGTNDDRHVMDQRRVKRGRQTNRLRKNRGSPSSGD